MSKLERRLILPFGVVGVDAWSDGSGRGEGGGEELEDMVLLREDMGMRGASWSRFSR